MTATRFEFQQFAALDESLDGSVLDGDAELWKRIGGFSGLVQIRRNAIAMVQFWQRKDPQWIGFFVENLFVLNILLILYPIELLIRFFIPFWPHLCGRVVAMIRDNMETRTQNLVLDFHTPDAETTEGKGSR